MSLNRPERKLVLSLLVNAAGQHQSGWRMPDSCVEDTYTIRPYITAAQLAEAAKMHMVFLADSADHDQKTVRTRPVRMLESFSVASALSVSTSNIGLIATFSTSFTEPYNVARQMCSLDHLSGGRSGWNMVTSYGGAQHYGLPELPDHAYRHKRAEEYADVIGHLFRGWDRDALVLDRAKGIFADPDKIHCDLYEGDIFRVRGPINIPRPPQGRPVIAQAGQSENGKNLAARHADLVYALGPSLEEAQAHYADLKARVRAFGRHADDLKILSGCIPVIGETEADALYLQKQLNDLIDIDVGIQKLKKMLPDVPLDEFEPNDVLPASVFSDPATTNGHQSRYEMFRYWSVEKKYTLRQLVEANLNGGGHWSPIGSAENIAGQIYDRFVSNASDGFNISSIYQLGGTERITKLLVPALQAAGYYRTQYEGKTLRENLGIAEPL